MPGDAMPGHPPTEGRRKARLPLSYHGTNCFQPPIVTITNTDTNLQSTTTTVHSHRAARMSCHGLHPHHRVHSIQEARWSCAIPVRAVKPVSMDLDDEEMVVDSASFESPIAIVIVNIIIITNSFATSHMFLIALNTPIISSLPLIGYHFHSAHR